MRCSAFDEVLKFVNDLAEQLSVPQIISNSQIIHQLFNDLYKSSGPGEKCPARLLNDEEWAILSDLLPN